MRTIINNGHKIEIKSFGTEKIYYDSQLVSSKNSILGATHVFQVNEENEEVQYEVRIGTRWHGLGFWVEARRRGQLIYTDR